jgi:hypothetical protein
MLKPEQVVSFSETITVHEDCARSFETSRVRQRLQPTNDPLRDRDIPPKVGVMPSSAYYLRASINHLD